MAKSFFAVWKKVRIFASDFIRTKSPRRYAPTADMNVRNSNRRAGMCNGSRVFKRGLFPFLFFKVILTTHIRRNGIQHHAF